MVYRVGAVAGLPEVRLLRGGRAVRVRLAGALHAPAPARQGRPLHDGAPLEQARLAPGGRRQVPLQAQEDRRRAAQVHRQGSHLLARSLLMLVRLRRAPGQTRFQSLQFPTP